MIVKFEKTDSTNNTVHKNETMIAQKECRIPDSCDLLSPVIIVEYDVSLLEVNYIRIDDFGRYYFTDAPVIVDGNKLVFQCRCDVLSSWWDRIKTSNQHVVRNQYEFNLYMKDAVIQTTNRPMKQVIAGKEINNPFLRSPEPQGHCFILNAM